MKVQVKYEPEGVHTKLNKIKIAIGLVVLILLIIGVCGGEKTILLKYSMIAIMMVTGPLLKAMGSSDVTDVECFEDRLECSCGEKEWQIDLVSLKKVTYDISRTDSSDDAAYFCILTFRFGKDSGIDEMILTDSVSEEHYEQSKNGEREELPILEIYYWIENLYPEKAGGRKKRGRIVDKEHE